MKISFSFFFSLLFYFFHHSTQLLDRRRFLKQGMFVVDHFYQLVVPPLKTVNVSDVLDCPLECVGINDCLSFNLAVNSIDGLKTCELLSTDKYASKADLESNASFNHHSINIGLGVGNSNPCDVSVYKEMKPYPDYGTGKYVCRCPAVVPNNTQGWTKVNTDPVKVGTKDNRPGIVKVPKPGKILKFKLVHVCGGISCSYGYPLTHFGCHQLFGLFITDTTKQVLSPKLKHQHASFYSIPGSTPYDAEFTLPEMSPTLNVANQQELQIWYGEDAFNHYETDNFGIVQIDLYCYYI